MTELKPAYHTSTDEVQEAMEMLGKGYHLTPRDEAKRQAFHLINATQSKVDALIDAIIDAAKAEIRAEGIKSSKRYTFGWKKIQQVYSKTNGKCYYCGGDLPADTDYPDEYGCVISGSRNWCIDHATPLARGGTNGNENLFPSCWDCNSKKGTMTADEFIKNRR
jgi:hypothetical protein